MIGKWPVMVIGAAEIDGQAWVSSQLAELEIADRYVDLRRETGRVRPGSSRRKFHARSRTTRRSKAPRRPSCLGLPPGATADPVEFTKDTAELAFQVKTTDGHAGGQPQIAVLPGHDHAERRTDCRHRRRDGAASERAAGCRRGAAGCRSRAPPRRPQRRPSRSRAWSSFGPTSFNRKQKKP